MKRIVQKIVVVILVGSSTALSGWVHTIKNASPYRVAVELKFDEQALRTLTNAAEFFAKSSPLWPLIQPLYNLYPELGYLINGARKISPFTVILPSRGIAHINVGIFCIVSASVYSLDQTRRMSDTCYIEWYKNQCSNHSYTVRMQNGQLKIFVD